MRFFKFFFVSLFSLILFVMVYRMASGLDPFISLSAIAKIFETFPDMNVFIEDLNSLVNTLSKLFILDREFAFDVDSNVLTTMLALFLDFFADIYDMLNLLINMVREIFFVAYEFLKWFLEFLRYITADYSPR